MFVREISSGLRLPRLGSKESFCRASLSVQGNALSVTSDGICRRFSDGRLSPTPGAESQVRQHLQRSRQASIKPHDYLRPRTLGSNQGRSNPPRLLVDPWRNHPREQLAHGLGSLFYPQKRVSLCYLSDIAPGVSCLARTSIGWRISMSWKGTRISVCVRASS